MTEDQILRGFLNTFDSKGSEDGLVRVLIKTLKILKLELHN
jgi:hypothetical protein